MPKPKHASSYSLTPDAKDMLRLLGEALGIPQSAVLELAIRQMAKREFAIKKRTQRPSKSA